MCARFAERYLDDRAKLASLLGEVDSLARRTHSAVEGLIEMQQVLEDRIGFLIVGESNVGRSSFIDTILGEKISSLLKEKKWSGVQFRSKDDVLDLEFPVKFMPAEGLEDFLVMESEPSENAKVAEVTEWSERADVIFWVFSVDNPWSNHTWSLLEKQSESVIDKSILILNRIDEREKGEMDVMSGHLDSLVTQRLKKPLPIYPVASNPEDLRGFEEIWELTNTILEQSPERQHYLDQTREKLHRVLNLIEDGIYKRSVSLDGDKGFLASLEAAIDRQREREIQLYAGQGINLSKEFVDQIDPSLDFLTTSCGVSSTTLDIFGSGRLASKFEEHFIENVTKNFVARSSADCLQILLECREQWRSRQHHLDERLGGDAGGFKQEPFKELIEELEKRQEKTARMAILSMKLRLLLEHLLKPRRRFLKKLLIVFFSFAILAGLLGTLNVPPDGMPALLALVFSVFTALIYCLSVYSSRGKVVNGMHERLVDLRGEFTDLVCEDYQDMICYFFTGYAPMFEAMRRKIVDAKNNLEPMQNEHHNLFLKLIAIENEMS